jgi:hypothetical protein
MTTTCLFLFNRIEQFTSSSSCFKPAIGPKTLLLCNHVFLFLLPILFLE